MCVWVSEGGGGWLSLDLLLHPSLPPIFFLFLALSLRREGLLHVDRRVWGATDYITVRNESRAYKDRSLSSLRILIGDFGGGGEGREGRVLYFVCVRAHFRPVLLSLCIGSGIFQKSSFPPVCNRRSL